MTNEELEWQQTTTKIIKAINDLEITTDREKVIKLTVQYMVYKMCESEEIFNDNLRILDLYANNGKVKKKV